MKRRELESMTRETLTIAAWCIHHLPVDAWADWVILLLDLLDTQSDVLDCIESTMISLHDRLQRRLLTGEW